MKERYSKYFAVGIKEADIPTHIFGFVPMDYTDLHRDYHRLDGLVPGEDIVVGSDVGA